MDVFLMTLLMLVSLFMMFIVLLQRGRGGGLAGAFGGAGGSSAFGTKAGDVFTKITVVVAIVWFLLAGLSGIALRGRSSRFENANAPTDEKADDDSPPTKSALGDDGDDKALPNFGELETPEKSTEDGEADKSAVDDADAPALPTPSAPETSEAEKTEEPKPAEPEEGESEKSEKPADPEGEEKSDGKSGEDN